MTKGVCLLGSPRVGGSSDQLYGAFCRAAAEKGAEIQSFALRDLLRACGVREPGELQEKQEVLARAGELACSMIEERRERQDGA